MKNKGFTHKELLISLLLVGLSGSILTVWLIRNLPREAINPARCTNNLKQMGLVFKMYANEHEAGFYPPPMILSDSHRFIPIPSSHELIPEYLTTSYIFNCPKNKTAPKLPEWDVLKDQLHDEELWKGFARSYNYYGWVLFNGQPGDPTVDVGEVVATLGLESIPRGLIYEEQAPAQMLVLYTSVRNVLDNTEPVSISSQDIIVPEGLGSLRCDDYTYIKSDKIFRLRENVDRWLKCDPMSHTEYVAQSQMPIMWDTPVYDPEDLPHSPGGLNVLFMDGHAEFIKYPADRFPATEGMAVWSRFNEVLLWGE